MYPTGVFSIRLQNVLGVREALGGRSRLDVIQVLREYIIMILVPKDLIDRELWGGPWRNNSIPVLLFCSRVLLL